VYFYGVDGQQLGAYPLSSGASALEIATYFGSKRLGFNTNPNNGSETATAPDRLGSYGSYYPWGESKSGNNPADIWSYATYWRDSFTGLDYANQRYYSNVQGRFMTPDPYSGSAAANNPQSWNGYSYAISEPVNMLDPTGQVPCGGQTSQSGSVITVDVYDCVGLLQPILPGFPSPMSPFENMGSAVQAGENAGLSSLIQFMQALQAAQAKTCSGLPDGTVMTLSAGAAAGLGVSGSAELVFNMNTGQISAFLSGSVTVSGIVTPGASVQQGFIWGLGQSNASYSGPFTGVNIGAAIIAAAFAGSSQGLTNPFNLSTPVTVTAGVQTPGASFSYGTAYYTNPLNVGNLTNPIFAALFPSMAQYYQDYQNLCGSH
jgi:RHS repeat-associated protein